jgi:hypothetical protein
MYDLTICPKQCALSPMLCQNYCKHRIIFFCPPLFILPNNIMIDGFHRHTISSPEATARRLARRRRLHPYTTIFSGIHIVWPLLCSHIQVILVTDGYHVCWFFLLGQTERSQLDAALPMQAVNTCILLFFRSLHRPIRLCCVLLEVYLYACVLGRLKIHLSDMVFHILFSIA